MATEAASSDYTSATDHEQTEKKVNEEVKAIVQDSVSFSKESVEEPKVSESPSPVTPLSKLEEVSENKHIEPLIPGVEKTDDVPISDLPVEDDTKEEKQPIPDSHTPSIPLPAPVEDTGNTQPEEQPAVEPAVKEAPEQVAISSLEKEQEEKPKVVDAHELITEAAEKLWVPLEVLPTKESEAVGINENKDSNVESIEVEKVEAAATETKEKLGEQYEHTKQVEKTYEEVQPEVAVMETKEKPAEQSELTKQVEKTHVEVQPEAEAIETDEKPVEQSELIKQVEKTYEEVETKGSVEVDSATNTGTSAEKDENTQFLKKEQTDKEEEPIVITDSEQVLTDQEAQTDLKEDGGEFCPPSTVSQEVDTEDKKELSGADVAEELSKKAVVDTEKVAEENEKRNLMPEESSPINEGDINSSISTAEVIEKSYEGENTGRDVEAIEENKGEQDVEDKIAALAETDKDEHLEEKRAEVSTERENTGRDIEAIEENKEEQNVEDKIPALAETDKDKHLEDKQTEVSTERENTGGDVEAVEENKEEQNIEDKIPALAETDKDEHLEEKQAEVSTERENTGRDIEAIEENKEEQNVEDKIPALAETDKDKHLEDKQTEVSTERENTGRDVEAVEENKEEQNVEDKIPALAETDKDKHLEEKQAEVSTERENTGRDVEVVEENKEEQNVEDKIPALAETDKDKHLEEKQAEVSNERENAGRDVEVVEENKEEQNVEAKLPALAESNKDEHLEEKQAEVTTAVSESLKESQEKQTEVTTIVSEPLKESQGKQAEVATVVSESLKESQENTTVVSEPLTEPQESELHLGSEKTVETGEDKLETEKVDEVAKSEVQNLEPPVNVGDEIKTSQDQPKEVPAKSTQKQSNNIISKVKQSLVKAKKAIIGKSPSSKTLSSDTKGDIKVK